MFNKSSLLFLILILTIGVGGFFYFKIIKNPTKAKEANLTKTQENEPKGEELIVSPQTPTDRVVVESAILQADGFLVLRQMDDGKLSQVIEMSQPLKKGLHKNIEIPLGSAEVSEQDLIVMIYEDYANDNTFNDLDMPAINENGFMTARYVKTGKPLPTSIAEGESAGMAHNMAGMKSMAKVRYTDNGFVPDKVEVPVGSTVEFINESSTDMWVASMSHPAHTILPTFDQFRAYKKGAMYRYVFDKKGEWEFHDHINPARGGVINVSDS